MKRLGILIVTIKVVAIEIDLASELEIDIFFALCEIYEYWHQVDDDKATDSSHITQYAADVRVK